MMEVRSEIWRYIISEVHTRIWGQVKEQVGLEIQRNLDKVIWIGVDVEVDQVGRSIRLVEALDEN